MTNRNDGRRAALWDVDGTLIDSSEYHWLSWRDALAAESFPITRERFAETFGQRNDEILRVYFPAYTPEEIARVGEAKEVRYREMIRERGIELLPGVRRWLDRLRAEGWLQAIASSAPRLNLEAIMSALGLEDYFAAITSAEDVTAGKPDPQVFLAAARKLSVAPSACVVVEDAPAGTEAARRARMRSIGVLSSHAELRADIVVRTLEELPDTAFDDLLAAESKDEGRRDESVTARNLSSLHPSSFRPSSLPSPARGSVSVLIDSRQNFKPTFRERRR